MSNLPDDPRDPLADALVDRATALTGPSETPPEIPTGALNRTVVALGLASFFSDMNHEMATAILPMFLVAVLGASPAVLGFIEGLSDASASFVKLGSGYWSDRTGERKSLAVVGYLITGLAKPAYALAVVWPDILVARAVGWVGRGIRTPVRDALLADAVAPPFYGRAFGVHRTMDTLGAIAGPAIAFLLLSILTYRQIFLVSIIPGLLGPLAVLAFVREARRPGHELHLAASLRALPRVFRLFLVAVGVFGAGNFAHTLLILWASQALTPAYGAVGAASAAVLLYTLHNVLYAGASYPVGWLSDRIGKRGLLGLGYALFGVMSIGFATGPTAVPVLVVLFVLAGLYIALVDAMEGAYAAQLLPANVRGTGYGALSTVNGVGDFISSVAVGGLWALFGPSVGFGYAAVLSVAGAALLVLLPSERRE